MSPCRTRRHASRTPARAARAAAAAPATLLLAAALLGLASCENEDAVLGGPIDPGATVSLSRDVQPLFTLNCATSGCHAGSCPGIAQANLSLEPGRLFDPVCGLVDVPSVWGPFVRVAPGDSDASFVVAKLEGTQGAFPSCAGGCGDPMPLGGSLLPAESVAVVIQWIDEGALDN